MKTAMSLFLAGAAFALVVGCNEKAPEPGTGAEPAPTAAAPGQPAAAQPAAAQPAGGEAGAQPTAASGGEAAEQAKNLFKTRCVICHGESGKGDGPTAAALNPKPRDYTDAEWQKSVTDADLAKIIVEGGPAVGKSALMPANPDLKDKPEVVNELVKIIRDFAPKG